LVYIFLFLVFSVSLSSKRHGNDACPHISISLKTREAITSCSLKLFLQSHETSAKWNGGFERESRMFTSLQYRKTCL